jgi:hypothetical protein
MRSNNKSPKNGKTSGTRFCRAAIPAAVAELEAAGQPGYAELVRNTAGGAVAVLLVGDRTAAVRAEDLSRHGTVALIADADESCGPAGWQSAAVVAASSRSAIISAVGIDVGLAQVAIAGARMLGTVALVDTPAEHLGDWAELFSSAGKSVLVLAPLGAGAELAELAKRANTLH